MWSIRLALLLTIFLVTSVVAQAPPPMTDEIRLEVERKMDWVKETEAQDFMFWWRFKNRPDPTAFEQAQDWYNPMALVDGGLAPFLAIAEVDEVPTIDPQAIEAASAYAFERNTQAFYVFHRGKIRYQRFSDGYGPTSAVASRSWVKTLTGMLTGVALNDGKIASLDEPVENYIAEWRGEPQGKITIRQILWNISGLEEPDLLEADPLKNTTTQLVEGTDVNAVVLARTLAHEPGTVFAHNNFNTHLMGMILHRATGVPFDKYLSEKLWQPVGAQRGALRRDRAYGGNILSFCCFLAAPSDWLRVGHLLMNDGVLSDGTRVLPEGWISEMKKGSSVNPNYGLHIWVDAVFEELREYTTGLPQYGNVHSEPFVAPDLFYLDGGANVRIWISPELELIVLRTGSVPPRSKGFDEAFIPNTLIRGIRK